MEFGSSGAENMRQQLTRIVRNKRQMESPAPSTGKAARDMIFTQMTHT
jgi:hypothetical protein